MTKLTLPKTIRAAHQWIAGAMASGSHPARVQGEMILAALRHHHRTMRPLLSLAAVAERLNISRQAVLQAVRAGRIRASEVHGPDGELAALVVEPGALERPEANARRRKRYLSLAAAGARMGVSRMTALREVRAGRLRAIEVEGPGGSLAMLVVEQKELARVMRGREARR